MARFSLSDLKRFLAVDPDHPYWMGIDVHKNSYHVALRRRDGNLFTWSAPSSPKRLLETITDLKIPIEGVCYESGPTGFTLARVLQSAGIPVIVGAASKVPRSVSGGSNLYFSTMVSMSPRKSLSGKRTLFLFFGHCRCQQVQNQHCKVMSENWSISNLNWPHLPKISR